MDSNISIRNIPCKRCMIAGLNRDEVLGKLADYIEAIEPSRRTEDTAYRARLAVCEQCPKLSDGMCRECGCFVLYRAAIAANSCPDAVDRWSLNQ